MTAKPPNTTGKRRPYTRSGCLVCKTRHLKCDELKPTCGQCKAAKWTCEYVRASPEPRSALTSEAVIPVSHTLSSFQPSQAVSVDIAEQRSFHYFQLCVAQQKYYGIGTDSWHALTLQAGRTVPAVQHSIFALGFLLQSRAESCRETVTSARDGFRRSSLLQYTKAIAKLSTGLASSQASEQSTLITCLLFIWIEVLQGNLDTALQHLRSGLGIIDAAVTRQEEIPRCLYDMYTRLHAQAKLHGSPTSSFNGQYTERRAICTQKHLTSQKDIEEARQRLGAIQEEFYIQARKLRLATGNTKVITSATWLSTLDDPGSNIKDLRHRLQNWQKHFEALTSTALSQQSSTATVTAMLQLQSSHLELMIEGVLCDSELDYDKHNAVFARMLSSAESILQPAPQSSFAMLPLEAGVIPPLFMVALKCRDPELRQKAITLLEHAPEQECMWRRDDCLALAKWKMRQEGQSSEDTARIHSERMSTVFVDGQPRKVLQYKKGGSAWLCESELQYDVAIMGDVL